MRVKIPFAKRFAPWMLEGVKIYDARLLPVNANDRLLGGLRHAIPGDFFHVFGSVFRITHVDENFTLGAIAERGYWESGFTSTEEFIAFWNEIHPHKGYNPNTPVNLYWLTLRDPTLADMVRARNWCPFCPSDNAPGLEIPCRHFVGYAGQVAPDPGNVLVQTPVSARIYRKTREAATVCHMA